MLRDLKEIDCDTQPKKPKRDTSKKTDDDKRQEEQESNDIIHKAEVHNWMKEKGTHKKESVKSHILIFSCCSLMMRSRMEATPNFETEI